MDVFLGELAKFASMVGVAFFSLWGSIPFGAALGLSPLALVCAAALGYTLGVAVVTIAGAPVRDWILKRMGRRATIDPESRFYRIWERYGMIGLALLAPITAGAQIGAALGVLLGAPPRRLFWMMSLCGLAWAVLLTMVVLLGLAGVQSVIH